MHIGIINLMPDPELYINEITSLLKGYSYDLSWIHLSDKKNGHQSAQVPDFHYPTLQQAKPFDLIVVTGAPVEKLRFEDVEYWQELCAILHDAISNGTRLLGVCWGAMAVAKLYGLDKQVSTNKAFGVYGFSNPQPSLPLMEGMEETFHWPVSTYATFNTEQADALISSGEWLGIGKHPDIGYGLLCSTNQQILLSLGHPEYSPQRLLNEYLRDSAQGLNTAFPSGLTEDDPVTFRHAKNTCVFSNWLYGIYINNKD
ncbi:homoserine O-succinyltransferase [Photobacterium makurazakiensis]|uniref:homoserine O-acetyltransferase/O-succinyltransferase family protein n=1 Tax=Photobacterium makurazakiensis TaxID=2910234 RepID=UPI003D1124B2